MTLFELVAVSLAVAGIFALLRQEHSARQVRLGGWQISMSRLIGFLLAMTGFLLLLGLESAPPEWWEIVDEKRTEKLTSWMNEPGRLAIFWFLAATCIGSAIVIVTSRTRATWLDACLVFCAGIVLLFGFLENVLACVFSMVIGFGVGWARRATSHEPVAESKSEQTIEPLLVTVAGVVLSWLLAVSVNWAVSEEAAPDRLSNTDRALPRVSSSGEVADAATVERLAAHSSNEAWLIALSFIFLVASGMIGMAHANRASQGQRSELGDSSE